MNKKGFTLIELLAVLTVLAIIALIAVPIVINLINDTKQTANKRSIDLYAKAVETALIEERLNGNKIQPGFLDSKFLDKVKYSGEKVECTVKLYEDKTIHLSGCKVGEKKVDYTYGESNITKIEPKSGETHKGIVYLDPTNLLAKCDETNFVSTTGTKTGCMKWYIYDDSGDNYKMILDHNTTARLNWNEVEDVSVDYEFSNAKQVVDSLQLDSGWLLKPRLISVDEILSIVGFSNWNETSEFYLSGTGSKKRTPMNYTSTNRDSYAWLYNNLYKCKTDSVDYGCEIEDNNKYDGFGNATKGYIYAYYTSSSVKAPIKPNKNHWRIIRRGNISAEESYGVPSAGIRPVIEVPKGYVD